MKKLFLSTLLLAIMAISVNAAGPRRMGHIDVGMVSENVGVCCGGTDIVLNDLIGYPLKK